MQDNKCNRFQAVNRRGAAVAAAHLILAVQRFLLRIIKANCERDPA